MSIDKIVFEKTDSEKETAIKTVLIYAGSSELKTQMKRLNIEYTKVCKGLKTSYILRGEKIGKIKVTL